MNGENIKLKAELDELNERIKSNQIGAEGKSHFSELHSSVEHIVE
jgi:hypothetical protein